jgi:AcrR family transcriptional regulator
MARRTRTPLTKQRVLRSAVKLADEGGFEQLSMRRLGQALGVEAMSLYNHVASKDEILDGIVDLVAAEVELPEAGGHWQPAMRQICVSLHDMFLRHPWAQGIWMARGGIGRERMRLGEVMLRTLREGGFSDDLAYRAFHVVQSHVIGYTAYQLGFPYARDELLGLAETFLKQFAVDEFPYLAEHVRQHMEAPPCGQSDFDFGLDLILDGLEAMRRSSERRRPSPTTAKRA